MTNLALSGTYFETSYVLGKPMSNPINSTCHRPPLLVDGEIMNVPSDGSGFGAAKVEFEVFVVDDVDDGTNDRRPIQSDPIHQRLQPT